LHPRKFVVTFDAVRNPESFTASEEGACTGIRQDALFRSARLGDITMATDLIGLRMKALREERKLSQSVQSASGAASNHFASVCTAGASLRTRSIYL
jgi:hypothetical protein